MDPELQEVAHLIEPIEEEAELLVDPVEPPVDNIELLVDPILLLEIKIAEQKRTLNRLASRLGRSVERTNQLANTYTSLQRDYNRNKRVLSIYTEIFPTYSPVGDPENPQEGLNGE